MTLPALLTISDTALELGVGESTVRRGIAAGTIPTVQLVPGGDVRVPSGFIRRLRGEDHVAAG